jgi:hypothetical protein
MGSLRFASADGLSNKFATGAWIVKYSLASTAVQPGSAATVNVEVDALKTTYDFQLWVMAPAPLSVQHGSTNDNSIQYDQLNQGDMRLESFLLAVPSTVAVGETYVINIKVQSYSNKPVVLGPLGAISVSGPDFHFDTTSDQSKSMSLDIVGLPQLSIQTNQNPTQVTRGDSFTISASLANKGTGPANPATLFVSISSGLQLNSISGFVNGSGISPGQTIQLTLNLQATQSGAQTIELKLASPQAEPAGLDIPLTVNVPLTDQLSQAISTYWWAILTLLLSLVALYGLARRHGNEGAW